MLGERGTVNIYCPAFKLETVETHPMELGKCIACGGRLRDILPHGPYIEYEICCIDCGYVDEAVIIFNLSREQIERISGDLEKIGENIKILGSKPFNREDLLDILKESYTEHIEKILDNIRIKLTTCVDCGRIIEYKTKKTRRCPECQAKYRREYIKKYMKDYRSKKKP